jgi:hypothetical protein
MKTVHTVPALFLLMIATAVAQPTGDTTKYQPVILNARACMRANSPPAYIAGIRDINDAYQYLLQRCYQRYQAELTQLGAADAAEGSFRNLIRDEWPAFMASLGYR